MVEEHKASPAKKAKAKKARPQSAFPADHPLACETFPESTPSTLDEFRDLMDWVYGPKPKKHASPTKRLMQQKEAAWKHKAFLSKNLHKGDKYSLTYVCDPKKTFVIQPKEGEIDYDMAEAQPVEFYKKVMKQKVTEHKVARAKTFTG